MKTLEFNTLLLKTAFSCMVCDGNIDDENEVPKFKEFCEKSEHFRTINYINLINSFIVEFNKKKDGFLKEFLNEISIGKYNGDQALAIVEIAFRMIYADNKVEYSEMKFFKLIRVKLFISNEDIILKFPSNKMFIKTSDEDLIIQMPEVEQFLEDEIITESYLSKISSQYFDTIELPEFELISFLIDNKSESANN